MQSKIFKIIKRVLIWGILSFVVLFAIFFSIYYFRFNITTFDRPTKLETKKETIEVTYVNWACDCADFLETKFYKNNPDYEAKEDDCIFIEPSEPSLTIPESYYSDDHFNKILRLTGHYYKNKGIPTSYEMKTVGEKPEKAKVFRYDKIEMIERRR
jgi:hypothetical protein